MILTSSEIPPRKLTLFSIRDLCHFVVQNPDLATPSVQEEGRSLLLTCVSDILGRYDGYSDTHALVSDFQALLIEIEIGTALSRCLAQFHHLCDEYDVEAKLC